MWWPLTHTWPFPILLKSMAMGSTPPGASKYVWKKNRKWWEDLKVGPTRNIDRKYLRATTWVKHNSRKNSENLIDEWKTKEVHRKSLPSYKADNPILNMLALKNSNRTNNVQLHTLYQENLVAVVSRGNSDHSTVPFSSMAYIFKYSPFSPTCNQVITFGITGCLLAASTLNM